MGLVYNWSTYDRDCNNEPLSILIEGGLEQDKPEWKAMLRACKDDGFSMNSLTLYGHNFIDMNNSSSKRQQDLDQSIGKIGCKEARYITIRLRKPLMACSDTSMYLA
jgi:hypothetical protein